MSHEVEGMMFVGATPWHGLGVRVQRGVTTDDAIRCAGLDWHVATKPLVTRDGDEVPAMATYRQSDAAILGVVGPEYTPVQNADAFRFFDPFIASGEASYETAGSLRGGRRVWILARLNRPSSVIVARADDTVEKFVLLSNSHDGSLAVRVGYTPVRVVCSNTLALAHGDGGGRLIRLRHTGNVLANLTAVREAMNLADAQFEVTADQYRWLATRDINSADLRRYVDVVFSAPRVTDDCTAQASERGRLFNRIAPLFEGGRGNDLPGVRGTWWAAYNAATEYLGYQRGRSQDGRVDSLWFGDGAKLNRRALDTAMRMAA
jgi:phage/plasmid-like protein (TIGR03299 family)